MTCLIGTLGKDFCALSQDTSMMVWQTDDEALRDPVLYPSRRESEHHAAARLAALDLPKVPLCQGDKFALVPHMHLVAGSTGVVAPSAAAYGFLTHGAGGARDVLELAEAFPERLRMIRDAFGGLMFWVVCLGWVERHGRAYGFQFLPGDDFEPTPIEPGHFIAPEIDTEDPAYTQIRDRWRPAAEGQDTEAFHGLVAANLDRAQAGGKYGQYGAGIGGRLLTARVDAAGITVRQTYRFAEAETRSIDPISEGPDLASNEARSKTPMRTASAGELLRRSLGNM